MLRRLKKEVFKDLPAEMVENIYFELSLTERDLYTGIQRRLAEEVSKLTINAQTLALIPVRLLRLMQCTDHPALIGSDKPSSKLATLKDIVEPLFTNCEKIVIFTQFAQMARKLHEEFGGDGISLLIEGQTPALERSRVAALFNDPTLPYQVCIMTEAGNAGLNMTETTVIVNYDLPWSFSRLEQRLGRSRAGTPYRRDPMKPIVVYNLLAKNSIDEYVQKVLHKKAGYSADLLKDVERLTDEGLDVDAINEILHLKPAR